MNIEGWTELCLAEILCSKNDKSKQVKSSEYQLIGLYPIVDQSSDFICGYCDDSKKVINNELPYTIFGDHTRHTKFVNFPFVVGADGTQIIKPIQSVDDRFFFYLVSDAANKIGNYGYDRHFKHLREFRCIFPIDKKEQKQIAEVLSTIDRAIAQTEAIIAKQQRIKTGLMQDLLTKGIDENGNIRSEATHKFKDSAIGRIPVEWKVVATGEVTNSLVPGRDKPDLDGGGIPWITIPDIDAMYICASKNGFSLSQKAIKLANARLMPRGTVLMSCVGEFGITTITEVEVIANQQLHGFICGDDILPEWLAIQINASGTRIDTLTTQTTIKYLNKTGCESILIALPNIDEQKRAISIFGNSLRFIATQEKHLAKLQHQKTGLMQGLLTGKVRVTNLLKEREPTSP
jgi:type I restriction enzyme S subunit